MRSSWCPRRPIGIAAKSNSGYFRGDAGLHRRIFWASGRAFPFRPTANGDGGRATPFTDSAPGSITEDDYTRQFSEELRLASTGDGPLQWLIGGYYSSFGATSHVYSYYPVADDGFDADFGTTNLADNHRKVDIDQYALFGEVSIPLAEQLEGDLGARYYEYHSNSVTSVSGVSANGTSNPLFGLAQNSGVTPKLDLAYIPDDNTTSTVTVSKGFRPGGPNSPIPCLPARSAPTSVRSG
jgi:outer membrane receptor protein involved in Fe transport